MTLLVTRGIVEFNTTHYQKASKFAKARKKLSFALISYLSVLFSNQEMKSIYP